MSEKLPNQATFEFGENVDRGEQEIMINQEEIGMLHAEFDNPKAKFDIAIEDMAGNVQFERKNCSNPMKRWGERVSLPVLDSYFKVRVSNVRDAKLINVFVE